MYEWYVNGLYNLEGFASGSDGGDCFEVDVAIGLFLHIKYQNRWSVNPYARARLLGDLGFKSLGLASDLATTVHGSLITIQFGEVDGKYLVIQSADECFQFDSSYYG
jgi:hypothetical protein